jgi:uncharacterized cupredoxin-like copper-binding protein
MKELRDRVLVPLALPLGAALAIVIVVLNFSQVLIALEERSGPMASTFVATVVASALLFGFAYFSARGEERSTGNLGALAGAGLTLVLAGFIAFAAIQEEEAEAEAKAKEKAAQEGPVDATVKAFDLGFDPKDLQVPSGKPRIEMVNDGAQLHTLLLEGVPGFKLEVSSKGDKDAGAVNDLKPGSYVFYCDVPGHRQAGMQGTLTAAEGAASGTASGSGPAGAGRADVVAGEIFFEPKEFSAPAGPVQVSLKNEGTTEHTLLVDAAPKFKKLAAAPGKSESGSLDVPPGEYVMYCDVPGHRAAGMEAKLKVG